MRTIPGRWIEVIPGDSREERDMIPSCGFRFFGCLRQMLPRPTGKRNRLSLCREREFPLGLGIEIDGKLGHFGKLIKRKMIGKYKCRLSWVWSDYREGLGRKVWGRRFFEAVLQIPHRAIHAG